VVALIQTHIAASLKVSSSIPDDAIGLLGWPNPSSHSINMGVNPVSNRNEYHESSWGGGKKRPARKADNLSAISEPVALENVGASTSHNPMGLHGLVQG
jgi:hypothetical protein